MGNGKKYTLSIAAVFRDEAPFLKEWIEYHLLVGVEHFYLFNNSSVDEYMSVLAPYCEKGIVTLTDWPDIITDARDDMPYRWACTTQVPAYMYACRKLAHNETVWLAMLDVDEFMVPVAANTMTEILEKYTYAPGVELFWHTYGNSYVISLPEKKLLIEMMHLTCFSNDRCMHAVFKTITKPECVLRFEWQPHSCLYVNSAKPVQIDKTEARLNHYMGRTIDFFETKIRNREKSSNETYSQEMRQVVLELGNQVEEKERPIFRFVPELRKRMGFDS